MNGISSSGKPVLNASHAPISPGLRDSLFPHRLRLCWTLSCPGAGKVVTLLTPSRTRHQAGAQAIMNEKQIWASTFPDGGTDAPGSPQTFPPSQVGGSGRGGTRAAVLPVMQNSTSHHTAALGASLIRSESRWTLDADREEQTKSCP